MLPNNGKTKFYDTAVADLKKELAKPRLSKSAHIAEDALEALRNPEPLSTTYSGSVDKIIPANGPGQVEQAQITIAGSVPGYRELRIENTLTDQDGNDVGLKTGAHVDVTIKTKRSKKM